MKFLIALFASLFAGLIAAAVLPVPALPTTTTAATTTRRIITATVPLPPPQHVLPRDGTFPLPLPTLPAHGGFLLLPRKGSGHLTKLVDHILDRLGHRLDKLTSVSSDGRVTINAPKCIGIGISACNPVHVGDNNKAEAGGWAGRVVEGKHGGHSSHDGHRIGGHGDDGEGGESEGSTAWGGSKKAWKSHKKEWKQKEKEWKKAAKAERKKNKKEAKKHSWKGVWDDDEESSSEGSGRANDNQGDWHAVEDKSSASDDDSDGKSREREAGEIDWSWGEDSVDFQPAKAGWANLGVAGRR